MIPEQRLLDKKELVKGHILKVYTDHDCTDFVGYAELLKPLNSGNTFIESEERYYDDEEVYFRQKWLCRLVSPDALPPFVDDRIVREQKFIHGREISQEFYTLLGIWKKLKNDLIEDEIDHN